MNQRQIFVMRHGESQEDIDASLYYRMTDAQIGLTQKGREQVEQAAATLRRLITTRDIRIFCSPSERVLETCKILEGTLADFHPKIFSDPRIIKQDWGRVTAANRKQIEAERYRVGVLDYHFPGGESGAELIARVGKFVDSLRSEIADPSQESTYLVVTHGLEMRIILMLLLGWTKQWFEQIAHPSNCFIAHMRTRSGIDPELLTTMPLYDATANLNHIAKQQLVSETSSGEPGSTLDR